jgi:resuscitation-promoting factor RpfB
MTSLNLLRWAPLSAAALLMAACGAPALTETAAPPAAAPTTSTVATSAATSTTTSPATTTSPTTTSPTATSPTTPAETTTTVTEVIAIPFAARTAEDALLDTGRKVVRTAGRAGSKTVTWTVRTRGGVEVGRAVAGEKVTVEPVDEVTVVGTKVAAPEPQDDPEEPADTGDCDPNYSGGCVPIASDVDCAGGKGNGPAYVRGPVQVVGKDIYGLDADHDGIGCE